MQQNSRLPLYVLAFTLIGFMIVSFLYLTQNIQAELEKKALQAEKEFYDQEQQYQKKESVPEIKGLTPEQQFETAWNQFQEKKEASALSVWNKLIKTHPELFREKTKDIAPLFYRYKYYRNADLLIQQSPESFDALFRARCAQNLRKFEESEQQYQLHLTQHPEDVRARKELFALYKITQQENSKKGRELLKQLLEQDQDSETISETYQEYLNEAIRQKNSKFADDAILIAPHWPKAYQVRGSIELARNQFVAARQFFLKAKELETEATQSLDDLLLKTYQEEYWATGENKIVEEAQSRFPKHPDVLEMELLSLLNNKDYENLFLKLEEAKELHPSTEKLKIFEDRAKKMYREETFKTHFSSWEKMKLQLGMSTSFPLLDKKFQELDLLEAFEHRLFEFANALMQQRSINAFFSASYQGTLLTPPLLAQGLEILPWEISPSSAIQGKTHAIDAWKALVQPFVEGDIRFVVKELVPSEPHTCLVLLNCHSKNLEYRGTLKISWTPEAQDWKIQQAILLEMKTFVQNHPHWFTEIPLPIQGNAPDLRSNENQHLQYEQLYDLVLGGISVADYNGDRLTDIYCSHRGKNILLKNLGNGFFEDVTDTAGVGDPGDSRGASFNDIDQDGDLDLFVCNFSSTAFPRGNALYRNNGDGTFTEATESAKLSFAGPCMNASWGDLDRDGDLDLFVSCFGETEKKPYQFIAKREDGTRNLLYINQGNGTFQEEGLARNFSSKSWSYGAYVGDINNDLLPDIYVINEFGPNHFYLNQGNLQFEEIGTDYNLRNFLNSRSVAVQDLNGDTFPDFILVNLHSYRASQFGPLFSNLKIRQSKFQQSSQGTILLLSTKNQIFREEPAAKLSATGSAYGCVIGDVTNDLQPYLYVTNGHYSSDSKVDMEDYEWRRFFLYQEALEKKFLAMEPSGYFFNKYRRLLNFSQRERYLLHQDILPLQLSFMGHTDNALFQLNTKGSEEVAFFSGLQCRDDSRAVVWADLDQDGDLDMILRTLHEVKFFRNEYPRHRGTRLTFKSPKPIYGTRVQLEINQQIRTRWIGSGEGFLTQGPLELHFGLGTHSRIDRLSVRWPDGTEQSWTLIENPAQIEITYGESQLKQFPFAKGPQLGDLGNEATSSTEPEKKAPE